MNLKKIFLIILILSFSAQIFTYIFFRDFRSEYRNIDVLSHSAVARDFLAGRGLIIRRFPPGYSLYLSLLYKITGHWDYKTPYIHIFSLLLLALSVSLSFIIFSRLFNIKVGLISALIFSVYPLYLFLGTRPGLSEHLFFFVFYTSLWIFILGIEKRSLFMVFLSSALFGYGSLTRYISLFYPVIISVYLFTDKRLMPYKKRLFTITFLSGYILSIIPWFLYLAAEQGAGFSYYLVNSLKISFRRYRQYEIARVIVDSNIENSIEFLKFLSKTIVNQFSTFFIILIKNLGRSWYATTSRQYHIQILLFQIPILLSAIWGFTVNLFSKNYRRNLLFCLFSILYFWISTALTTGIVRVMLICMPFVFVLSAFGIIDIYKRINFKLPPRHKDYHFSCKEKD